METKELLDTLKRGEDSHQQFKRNITNTDALAADMVAFSNGVGGRILLGVDDDGSIAGLTNEDVRRLNQMISNTASQGVHPAINPVTENVWFENGLVIVIEIPSGINKPYQDKNGVFWVKSGSDKRKATSREEIQRLFQRSNLIHADELPVSGTTVSDISMEYFKAFFLKRFSESLDTQGLSLPKILENMNLLQDGFLNVACALLFMDSPELKLPSFIVKAGAFDANDLSTTRYNDSRNIVGKLTDVFKQTVNFIITNLHHVQGDQNFNSVGIPEIPREAIEEMVSNALIHRDYFISAPVRVFIFRNRVEIISPGHLPNSLTVDNIKAGNSVTRNPVLASYANHLLPYRGYGTGILRALSLYRDIDFLDDQEGNLFKAVFKRKERV
ncbi:MAG: putative DNA binding domain-containing protein [Peptococcaceae bacterium]|nr:putative DNA binding domain-containing protein [Peptococcaceae bacterium]